MDLPPASPAPALAEPTDSTPRAPSLGVQNGVPKTPNSLAPPAVSSLRADSAGMMRRSLSEDIREEREELREAAEQTLNVIMDLNLDGRIRWVSPSWVDVIGTLPESVQGVAISDLIVSDNKTIFAEIVESMQKDDSKSQFIRFVVNLGPLSRLASLDAAMEGDAQPERETLELEAQGIMVYDTSSGGESHVSCLHILLNLWIYVDH